MDFATRLEEVVADTYDELPPKDLWEKFWLTVVSTLGPLLSLGGQRLSLRSDSQLQVAAYLPGSFSPPRHSIR